MSSNDNFPVTGHLPVTCLMVVGTRPEVLKMAPLMRAMTRSKWASPYLVTSGQHRELLDLALTDCALVPDRRLTLKRGASSILTVLKGCIEQLEQVVDETRPAFVVAQGDTTTALAASIVAFYHRVPFVHVEAGLRTGDLSAPFPEEYNRKLIAQGTSLHCAPTAAAAQALLREGFDRHSVVVTGNTIIDLLLETAASFPDVPHGFPDVSKPILVTAHRRESFGPRLGRALLALRELADRLEDIGLYVPVHPNPEICEPMHALLGGHPRITLADPLGYRELVAAMQASWLVITDSGGLQEEAPTLGKPVLVLRDSTERPEAVRSGGVRLVGTEPDRIAAAVAELHRDPGAYSRMAQPRFEYGDGRAAARILAAMAQRRRPNHQAQDEPRSDRQSAPMYSV